MDGNRIKRGLSAIARGFNLIVRQDRVLPEFFTMVPLNEKTPLTRERGFR